MDLYVRSSPDYNLQNPDNLLFQDGLSPLMMAAATGSLPAVLCLLDHNPLIDATVNVGNFLNLYVHFHQYSMFGVSISPQ